MARRFQDRIRKNSEARIVTQGLLGDKLVEISPGSPEYPPLAPGDVIASEEPVETSRIFGEAAKTLATVNRLAGAVQGMVEKLEKGGTAENLAATVESARRVAAQLDAMGRDGTYGELAATVRSARRIAEEVEKGKGLLHALVYDEPETLRRLNALLGSAQDVLARTRDGQSAVGVLLSPDSARAGRSLVMAMEALGRGADKASQEGGLLSALLYDPQYKTVAGDLQVVARNFRDVSERLARGQGLLGGLLADRGDGPMGEAGADFARAMSNLRVITDRLRAGEGTIGGLLEDPTVYENLAAFLEGAQRSFLLRTLIRSSIGAGGAPTGGASTGSASPGSASPGPPRARGSSDPRFRSRLMPRERSVYRCQTCGFAAPKAGTCPDCAPAGQLRGARGGARRARALGAARRADPRAADPVRRDSRSRPATARPRASASWTACWAAES